ncbi:unnamed protein product [Prorocentrum cordatum]|uniref:C3H1-type domain-containing protein n=1 Tax=Prorocentrum cordatum TaxID=2364126 RepID=A0ABN9RZ68_9DINO|nr:unnamed protein product [Polarella glacialis]
MHHARAQDGPGQARWRRCMDDLCAEDCCFAHGRADVRTAPDFSYTQLCRRFTTTGTCPQGAACQFAHARGQLVRWARHGEVGAQGGAQRHDPPRAAQRRRQQEPQPRVARALEGRQAGDRPESGADCADTGA